MFTFISGATGGLGSAYAEFCAGCGYDLFLTARSEECLAALKDELCAKYNVNILYFPCELTDDFSRKDLISFVEEKGVKFDRIINVAGVDTQKAFLDYTPEKAVFQIRVNCEATLLLTLGLLGSRAEKTEVLTVGSMSGVSPMPYFAIYSASKAFLQSFFTSLHYELKNDGVKVTTVLPGGIPTRPDIVEEIKKQGLGGRLSSKPAGFVVKKSLKAVKKNKIICVPGAFNKFLFFLMKIAPKRIVLNFIAKRWKKHGKDAF
ncbi:MAG: SDR family NAD(P)-dependent oxidoreductase [Clostridia bacterium]|nr:SDR family NAD(P)-dependent oxidoreductase [Clostridia bacterium]